MNIFSIIGCVKYFESLDGGNIFNCWMAEINLIIEYMFNHWIGEIFQPLDGGNYLSLDCANIFNHNIFNYWMGKYFQSLDRGNMFNHWIGENVLSLDRGNISIIGWENIFIH